LGMHCMIIEFSRNVCNLENANSSEVDPTTPHPVIDLLEDQDGVPLGGTMRLGAYDCQVAKGSLLEQAYHIETISERHRHRYEFNDTYRGRLEAGGMKFTGINPERNLVETVEVPGHPWFFGCQFHPEYKSRPRRSAPLFRDFIREALKSKEADRD